MGEIRAPFFTEGKIDFPRHPAKILLDDINKTKAILVFDKPQLRFYSVEGLVRESINRWCVIKDYPQSHHTE